MHDLAMIGHSQRIQKVEIPSARCHQMNDRLMAHGNTLRSPSGAGGENDIRQLLGPLVTIPRKHKVLVAGS